MKIGLYFGSFNPVHNGHLIIANHVINYTDIQQVWMVISPQNPLKKSKTLLNENHRKLLVDVAIEGEENLRSSNVEFKLPKPSYTVDTLTYLNEQYPQHEFIIIMGSDSFSNLKRWKNYSVILRDYEIYVYMRPEFPIANDDIISKTVCVLDAPLLEISSTSIRKMIASKKSIRYMVPDIVIEEIHNQGYYL